MQRFLNDPFDSYLGIEQETYIKKRILQEIKKKKLLTKTATNKTISEEEYWQLFYSHSNSEDIKPFSKQKYFSSEWYRICSNKSNEFFLFLNRLWITAHKECNQKTKFIRNLPFRIACFSGFEDDEELSKNTTMWSHYADNHKGFCVKYSLDSIENIDAKLKCGLYKVRYTKNFAKTPIKESLHK